MDKNLKLLYFSATENTEKIVKEIAGGINDSFLEYNLTPETARAEDYSFNANDLLIIGAPVYSGRIPEFLAETFAKIEGNNTLAVFVVTYGNRDYDDALLELQNIFEQNGFRGIAGGAFIGEHSYSREIAGERPDHKDLKLAREFGHKIKARLDDIKDLSEIRGLKIKGSYPYKKRTERFKELVPETTVDCTKCGICAEECPMNAISFKNFIEIKPEKCIRCCSCIQKCPEDAKYLDHPGFNRIRQYLINNFSDVRLEPEVFII